MNVITENIPKDSDLFCDLGAYVSPVLIAAVGAGGKTSTLLLLADLFQKAGRRVLLTTTTHMLLPNSMPVIFCKNPQLLPPSVWQKPLQAAFSAWLPQSGKVKGFSCEQLDGLIGCGHVDVVLVEADGAHGFALKAPDEHEPCIPESCHCVIALTGSNLIGHGIGPSTVHRWPLFSRITSVAAGERLTWQMLTRLIQHPEGAFKNTPAEARRVWLLNQFSQNENLPTAELLRNGDVDAIWAGSVQEHPAILRRQVRKRAATR